MNTIWETPLKPGRAPKYEAVAGMIRGAIAEGRLSAGEKLPPVRDLAWRLEITPGTVARAYSLLTDEGLLSATVGRGTFVADRPAPVDTSPASPAIEVDPVPHGTAGQGQAINLFSPALPEVGQAALIRRLLAQVAEAPPSGLMHYPTRAAFRPAREAVLTWLRGTPLGTVSEADIVLAHGGQNAILLVMQAVLSGRRPAVLVEELSYPGFRRAAELLRAEVIPVAMDEHGLIPEALEAAARSADAQILCTSPEMHNPTGLFTPPARREALVEVARRHDLQILEDDCYRMGAARAPSYRMLAPERGWYVSSISKNLTPALRLGFAIAPHGQVAPLRRAAEHGYFGIATPLADLAALLLAHPDIDPLSARVRAVVGSHVRAAVNHLGAFDLVWRDDLPFLWLRLPAGWRASAFCQAAEAEGIRIRPAEEFGCRDARAPHAVRIAVNAVIGLEAFEGAMARLAALLRNPPERISV